MVERLGMMWTPRHPVMVMAVVFCFLLFAGPTWAQQDNMPQPQALPLSPLYILTDTGRHDFRVELARTPQERSIGLMYRHHMDADRGMLFANGVERQTSFWMKNTFISLDIIFVHRDGRVANIAADTIPLSLASVVSHGPVFAVLELNAGTAAQIGLRPGDMIHHPLFQNYQLSN